jgi:molybdate transport system substrate-binding protein
MKTLVRLLSWPRWPRQAGRLALALGLLGFLASLIGTPARAQQSPAGTARIAAAANLQPALTELVALFNSRGPGTLVVTYGSSANLVRQIQQGLPSELFLSADEDFALRLADSGWSADRGAVYATGRLALLVPNASKLVPDAQLAGLQKSASGLTRFAIANPELAPYGRAAVQVLQQTGLWPQLQGKLAIGESIAQTTQYVSSGAADAGLTALSLALAPEVAARTRHAIVDAALHAPLRQRMVLRRGAEPLARAFYEFLLSPAARAVWQRHGYV